MTIRTATMLMATMLGIGCISDAAWIHVKARVAQLLIAHAWQRTQHEGRSVRPWPWADTNPVARLIVGGTQSRDLVVLEGSSGRNLAFGPAHDSASVLPGDRGNSIIAGHRDTHFRFLKDLRTGDRLAIERPGRVKGARTWFVVTDTNVVDSRTSRIALQSDVPRLTLVTCYPFDAVTPGGPLRFVVTAQIAQH